MQRDFSRSAREGGPANPAPLPPRTRRAIAYLRVSTAVQEAEGMGLAIQRERVTEHARREGFELLEVVQETASGGVRDSEVFSWEHRPRLARVGGAGESRGLRRADRRPAPSTSAHRGVGPHSLEKRDGGPPFPGGRRHRERPGLRSSEAIALCAGNYEMAEADAPILEGSVTTSQVRAEQSQRVGTSTDVGRQPASGKNPTSMDAVAGPWGVGGVTTLRVSDHSSSGVE